MKIKKINAGQSLVEVVIAAAIFIIIAATSVVVMVGTLSSSRRAEEETMASSLANQGIEAVRSIANQSWDSLNEGTHGVVKGSNVWGFSGISDSNGKFTREVIISPVNRDASGNIVLSGGSPDSSTKHIVSRVTWNFIPTKVSTVESSAYITDWVNSVYSLISATVSPNPSIGPTLSPLPTIAPTSCLTACFYGGYANGTCRRTCNAEEKVSTGGGSFCIQGQARTCCCY